MLPSLTFALSISCIVSQKYFVRRYPPLAKAGSSRCDDRARVRCEIFHRSWIPSFLVS